MSYRCDDCGYLSLGTDDTHDCITVLKDENRRLRAVVACYRAFAAIRPRHHRLNYKEITEIETIDK